MDQKNPAAPVSGLRLTSIIAVAIILTALYALFIIIHQLPANPIAAAAPDSRALAEQTWLHWLAGSRDTAQPLPVDDSVAAPILQWAGKHLVLVKGKLPAWSGDWETLPPALRALEGKLPESTAATIFSASAGALLFHASHRPPVPDGFAWWLENQAAGLMGRGYRAEGLALLQDLQPWLAGRDPEFAAWLGSGLIMRAMDAQSGLDKIKLVEEGLTVINAALLAAPDNLNCRYIRAQTLISLPEFYADQRRQGLADFDVIAGWLATGKTALVTDRTLHQVPRAIDPQYLSQSLDWARHQPGWSDADLARLAGISQRNAQ